MVFLVFFGFFVCFAVFIDLLTDTVPPLFKKAIPIAAGPAILYSSLPPPPDSSGSTAATAANVASAPSASSAASELFESVNDVALHFVGPLNGSSPCLVLCLETKENDVYVYVKSVFVIHVGGTRYVTSSTDNIMKIHARITLTVEFIRICIFLFLFYVLIQLRV